MTKDNSDNFMSKDNVSGSLDALNKHASKDNSDDGLINDISYTLMGRYPDARYKPEYDRKAAEQIIAIVRQHDKSQRNDVIEECVEAVLSEFKKCQPTKHYPVALYSAGIIKTIEALKNQ